MTDDEDDQSLSPEEVLQRANMWPEGTRDEAAGLIRAILEGERRAWYCTRGRSCDGEEHAGFMYPHARGDQWPPPGEDWFAWFLSGGRGSGKTRTGAEYARRMSERVGRMALIAPTGADVRDTMIEGVSGLQAVCALAGQKIHWEPSKRRVTFENGCIATTFSGEEPDRLRGPNHGFAWLDEPAHMPLIEEVWSNLMFGLRIGKRPHVVLTSTPLPTEWVKRMQAKENTVVVRVSTYANLKNLAENFRQEVVDQYEGTRKGRQELYGEVLLDVEGALWQEEYLTHDTVDPDSMDRIVIGVDPAGTANKRSDLTGIVVAGVRDKKGYVLADHSGKYSPQQWSAIVNDLYEKFKADCIVAERNYGGDMVKDVILRGATDLPPRIKVPHGQRSKSLRAEPIVALYEQSKVIHRTGSDLSKLENEMLTWVPASGMASPNRVDALVWALSDLMRPGGAARIASARGGTIRPTGPFPFGPRRAA
jgi:phage terminase large subunit-like protein